MMETLQILLGEAWGYTGAELEKAFPRAPGLEQGPRAQLASFPSGKS